MISLTASCLAATTFFLVLSLIEAIFRRLHVIISIATVLCVVAVVMTANISDSDLSPIDGVPIVYTVIVMTYMVLPLPKWWTLVVGSSVAVGHVVLIGIEGRSDVDIGRQVGDGFCRLWSSFAR